MYLSKFKSIFMDLFVIKRNPFRLEALKMKNFNLCGFPNQHKSLIKFKIHIQYFILLIDSYN